MRRLARTAPLMLLGALVAPASAFAHGDAVPVSRLASAWDAAPVPIAGAVVALALFGRGFVRLRRRGRRDRAPWSRAALFTLGVAVLTLALVSPLDAIGEEYLLWVHMTQHVLIGDVAPALLMVAIRGPLAFFLLPPVVLSRLARVRPLRAVLHNLLRPWVSFAIWVAVGAGWHVPRCYDYALSHAWAHQIEHGSFFAAGCLVWAQLVDPARRRALSVPTGRVLFAAGLFVAGHALVHPILFGAKAVYTPYALQDERLLGLTPLADQKLAGVVMTLDQVLTLGTLFLVLAWPQIRRRLSSLTEPDSQTVPAPVDT
ncbi:MAG TPA: cytochrome c oxidase assembly protein [Gaiellaceae bacterium]